MNRRRRNCDSIGDRIGFLISGSTILPSDHLPLIILPEPRNPGHGIFNF